MIFNEPRLAEVARHHKVPGAFNGPNVHLPDDCSKSHTLEYLEKFLVIDTNRDATRG